MVYSIGCCFGILSNLKTNGVTFEGQLVRTLSPTGYQIKKTSSFEGVFLILNEPYGLSVTLQLNSHRLDRVRGNLKLDKPLRDLQVNLQGLFAGIQQLHA